MKKIITIGLVVASFAATSSFGQGYFLFTSGKSQAWNGFTTAGVSATSSLVDTSFLWAPAGTTSPMAALLASTPTTGNSTTVENYTVAQAWTAILSGGFNLATNNGGSVVVQATAANGGIAYNSSGTFPILGTANNGTTAYTVFMIGWNSAFATPALAAAVGSAVGWSTAFQYTPSKDAITAAPSMSSQGANFGVFIPVVVPEPTTLALAGLSGASLLLFRRKK